MGWNASLHSTASAKFRRHTTSMRSGGHAPRTAGIVGIGIVGNGPLLAFVIGDFFSLNW